MIPDAFRDVSPLQIIKIAADVWSDRDTFIRWPKQSLVFKPGAVRINYHNYSQQEKQRLKEAGIKPDSRSNGPAIVAFLLAGGERPKRVCQKREWSIHHIYDGKYPWHGEATTTHAVKDGRYFTEAAGLVAVHPIADALADEVPYFAWLLRFEAFLRFGFDPDNVFGDKSSNHPPK